MCMDHHCMWNNETKICWLSARIKLITNSFNCDLLIIHIHIVTLSIQFQSFYLSIYSYVRDFIQTTMYIFYWMSEERIEKKINKRSHTIMHWRGIEFYFHSDILYSFSFLFFSFYFVNCIITHQQHTAEFSICWMVISQCAVNINRIK